MVLGPSYAFEFFSQDCFSALAPVILFCIGLHYFYCRLARAGPSYSFQLPSDFICVRAAVPTLQGRASAQDHARNYSLQLLHKLLFSAFAPDCVSSICSHCSIPRWPPLLSIVISSHYAFQLPCTFLKLGAGTENVMFPKWFSHHSCKRLKKVWELGQTPR